MEKEHLIFKAIVEVYNQQDCDIAREICERYELPMWEDVYTAFKYVDYNDDRTYLQYYSTEDDEDYIGFYVDNLDGKDDYNILSIKEFEELANNYNPQSVNMEDILSTIKELNNFLNNK
jgi:hypothetical protein